MAVEFKLPDIGEGVAEGEITKWIVKEGDEVQEDQPMVEVMTDKATVEIPSPVSGRVAKILHPEGATVPVNTTIVILEAKDGGGKAEEREKPAEEPKRRDEPKRAEGRKPERAAGPEQPEEEREERPARERERRPAPDEDVARRHERQREGFEAPPRRAPAPRRAAEEEGDEGTAAARAPETERREGRVLAAPATRKLARELGVDLAEIEGSGPRGRVTKEDVRGFLERKPAPAPPVHREEAPARPLPVRTFEEGGEERIPYRGIRKATGDQMVRSAYTAPHFTYVDEIDMTRLYALRKEAAEIAKEYGIRFTFLPFIIKALCAAIRRHPTVNSQLDEEAGEIIVRNDVHVGIATDTDRGLLVPVVKNADRKSALEIAGDIQRLSEAAREGSVKRDELKGSTITITSAGSIGGLFATPIINHPEVAILGVYQIKDKPVIRDGAIVPGKIGYLSLTLDHRVVDGATGAHFMNHMKRVLENPGLLTLE